MRWLRLLTLFIALIAVTPNITQANADGVIDLWIAPQGCGLDPWQFNTFPPDREILPRLPYIHPQQQAHLIPLLLKKPQSDTTQAEYSVQLSIHAPDQTLYFDSGKLPFFSTQTEKKFPTHAENKVTLIFEPKDTAGIYTLTTTFFIGDEKVDQHIDSIELKPFEWRGDFNDFEDFEHWMHTYYARPQIDRALTAFIYLTPFELDKELTKNDIFTINILRRFFTPILKNNEWLIEPFSEQYDTLTAQQRLKILFLYAQLHEAPPDDEMNFNPQALSFLKWAREQSTIPTKPLTAGIQLDMLWAEFFASGRYKPFREIISALEYHHTFIRHYEGQTLNENERQQAVLYKLARWSIEENLKEHPLLRAYTHYAWVHTSESSPIHISLGEILKNVSSEKPSPEFKNSSPSPASSAHSVPEASASQGE